MDAARLEDRREQPTPYSLFMLALSSMVLALLVVQIWAPLSEDTLVILDAADTAICGIFLLDFLRSLTRSTDRWGYLLRWGWIDLLSSIPSIDWLRWGRAARIFRILRVLRGFRAVRIVSGFLLERRVESAFWTTCLLAIQVVVFGSVAILHLEVTPEANIRSPGDALWWSIVTVTTVGYGDLFPVTPFGRVLAVAMMLTGIGLFGTFTAFVASSVGRSTGDDTSRRLEDLARKVEDLRKLMEGR